MIKFLTCASYYGTGSSAVTDLISEYDGVDNLTDYEFRFLHDPYGVRDLQYYLIDNPNRHNSGFGLKKFIKYTKCSGRKRVVQTLSPFSRRRVRDRNEKIRSIRL